MSPCSPSPGLAEANALFRAAYAEARDAAARAVPILVVLADDLILRFGEQRSIWHFTPPGFHDLKSAAHVLVVVTSLLSIDAGAAGYSERRTRLEALQRALSSLSTRSDGSLEADPGVRRATDLAKALVARALHDRHVSADALAAHAREARPVLLELTGRAARGRLASLHACVEEALRQLDSGKRAALRVVVAGDHQARARSLGMQYFQRRLPDHGSDERAVIYGESVTSEEEAVALIGTCRVDRTIAGVIFGDPNKLQQDVLGDATQAELDAMALPRIT